MLQTKTFFPKEDDFQVRWHLVDAEGRILGRLASRIATILRGKHHPSFTPHFDGGFRVAVVNAEKIRLTGKKEEQKKYFRHSGYPGGETLTPYKEQMKKKPEEIIRSAVRGMLPKNRLGSKLIKGLKVYVGPDHPHQAQNPEVLEF